MDFEPREGEYQPWSHRVAVRVHHWQGDARVSLDGKRQSDPVIRDGVLSLTIGDPRRKSRLSLRATRRERLRGGEQRAIKPRPETRSRAPQPMHQRILEVGPALARRST